MNPTILSNVSYQNKLRKFRETLMILQGIYKNIVNDISNGHYQNNSNCPKLKNKMILLNVHMGMSFFIYHHLGNNQETNILIGKYIPNKYYPTYGSKLSDILLSDISKLEDAIQKVYKEEMYYMFNNPIDIYTQILILILNFKNKDIIDKAYSFLKDKRIEISENYVIHFKDINRELPNIEFDVFHLSIRNFLIRYCCNYLSWDSSYVETMIYDMLKISNINLEDIKMLEKYNIKEKFDIGINLERVNDPNMFSDYITEYLHIAEKITKYFKNNL